MRRLKRAPQCEFALDLVERRYALTGLEWARVHAWINDHLFDRDVCLEKSCVGLGLVAGLPIEDMVVMLTWAMSAFFFVFNVLADYRCIGSHCFERIDVARQRFVFDFDQFGGIGRDVPVLGDDESHFLVLEKNFSACG